jgi:hypothetical protein
MANKMKSLPPSEREAYALAAKDESTKKQLIAMLRTMKHFGFAVPLAAGAGFASQQDRR